ncbi:hypothetical protein EDB85DRAFT_1888748 [Lactarius pseudohatsudake]|nr:hypothetical protein EDB85DRAFT_1888748 [Lactarius pseudohatsudake]
MATDEKLDEVTDFHKWMNKITRIDNCCLKCRTFYAGHRADKCTITLSGKDYKQQTLQDALCARATKNNIRTVPTSTPVAAITEFVSDASAETDLVAAIFLMNAIATDTSTSEASETSLSSVSAPLKEKHLIWECVLTNPTDTVRVKTRCRERDWTEEGKERVLSPSLSGDKSPNLGGRKDEDFRGVEQANPSRQTRLESRVETTRRITRTGGKEHDDKVSSSQNAKLKVVRESRWKWGKVEQKSPKDMGRLRDGRTVVRLRGVKRRRRMVTQKKENGDKESNQLKERGRRGNAGGVDEAHYFEE